MRHQRVSFTAEYGSRAEPDRPIEVMCIATAACNERDEQDRRDRSMMTIQITAAGENFCKILHKAKKFPNSPSRFRLAVFGFRCHPPFLIRFDSLSRSRIPLSK